MSLLRNSRSRSMCNCAVGATREVVSKNGKAYKYKDEDVIKTWRVIIKTKEGLCPDCGYYPLEVPYDRVRENAIGIQAGMGTRTRGKGKS